MLRLRFSSFLCLCFITTVTIAETSVQIFVNPGSFENIEKAAISEKEVNFWDNDLTDDDACTECFAATELRKYLSACTNMKDINLSWGKDLPDSEYVFVLGNRTSNHLIKELNPDSNKLNTPESFSITSITQGTKTICIIEGYDRVGTLYGVYEYLKQLGVRFFGLGEQGTVYPREPVALPSEMNLIECPGFFSRGYYAWESRGTEELFLWMARNRMNYWTAAQKEVHFLNKLGIRLSKGFHDLQNLFLDPNAEYPYDSPLFRGDEHKPKDPYTPSTEYVGDLANIAPNSSAEELSTTYFAAHPEWYGLHDGKRSNNTETLKGDNFCTSNRDAVRELSKKLIQGLIDGSWRYADIVNLYLFDMGRWCECESCKKLGTPTDRLLLFVHQVNQAIQKAQGEGRLKRDIQVTMAAY